MQRRVELGVWDHDRTGSERIKDMGETDSERELREGGDG